MWVGGVVSGKLAAVSDGSLVGGHLGEGANRLAHNRLAHNLTQQPKRFLDLTSLSCCYLTPLLNFLAAFFFSSSLLFRPHLRLRGSRYRLLSSYFPLFQCRHLCRSPLIHLFRLLGGARLIASFPRHAFVPLSFRWNLHAPAGPTCCFRGFWRALPCSCLLATSVVFHAFIFSIRTAESVFSLLMSHSIYTKYH